MPARKQWRMTQWRWRVMVRKCKNGWDIAALLSLLFLYHSTFCGKSQYKNQSGRFTNRPFLCTICVRLRVVEDVDPYKSCFESLAKIHFPYQRNKKRAIFLIPCRGRRPRRPARKSLCRQYFYTQKGQIQDLSHKILFFFCQTNALACPYFVYCRMVPQIDKRKNKDCRKKDPLG